MKVHTDRSILEELQDLYDLAVREHGHQALSSQIIGESLQAERRHMAHAPELPAPLRHAGRRHAPAQGGQLPA